MSLGRYRFRGSSSRQHGLAVLITLLIVLGIGIGLVTSGVTRSVPLHVRADNRALSAMAEAKQALIGRAVADNDRPGSLPCPDVNNDGVEDAFVGVDCPSYIGRLPWKTLGLPDLRDEHGERLWYALSPKYRDHVSAQPINSDTPATVYAPPSTANDRVVYANTTATLLAPAAVAVIFSPGGPIGGQTRTATAAPCAATGAPVAANLCVSNYLDAAASLDNASSTGPYIAAARTASFNDRLTVLTAAELMPLVERRVAHELRTILIEYYLVANCNKAKRCFPWAGDAFGVSVVGQNRGRVPWFTARPDNWDNGKVPPLPTWFNPNRWGDVIYYTAAETRLDQLPCPSCTSPTLILDGVGGGAALFFMPGAAAGPPARTPWGDYIDDAQNRDGDDIYITPTSSAVSRDQLFALPGASLLQCTANARMLVENVPCLLKTKKIGKNKKDLKPECEYARENLVGTPCSCAAAATVLTTKPCSKKLKQAQCKVAVATLKAC
jgi:hypothetical protein